MTSFLECNARAALCRQLARLEPDSKSVWLAEAERWSRLTQEPAITVATRHCERAEIWRWKAITKRKGTEVRFELRNHSFEEFFCGLSLEAGEPN